MEWISPDSQKPPKPAPPAVAATGEAVPRRKRKGYRPAMMALADEDLRLSVGGKSGAQTLNVQKLGY